MMHDAGRGDADAALDGLIRGFVRVGAKDGDHGIDFAELTAIQAVFAQHSFFAHDDPIKGDGWAFLRKSTAEVDAEIEQLVPRFQRRSGSGMKTLNQSFRHVRINEGKSEIENHRSGLYLVLD